MKLQDFLGNIGKLKTEIEGVLTQNNSLAEAKKSVEEFVKQTETELKNVVEKDLPKLAARLKKERESLENKVEKIISKEMKKAQDFAKNHQKDLEGLQRKVEGMLEKRGINLPEGLSAKKSAKKADKKAKSAKKTVKKATQKTTKKTTKKKASATKPAALKQKSPKVPKSKKDHPIQEVHTKISPKARQS